MLDIRKIRDQFPITRQRFQVLGQTEPKPLIYLDHGASTHPPTPVLDTYKEFLEHSYANVHRGRHYLSEMATDRFEHVSDDIFRFIRGSRSGSTVILCGNTTQALDLAAHVMAHRKGVTLVSLMEHHSNDLPHRARGPVVHFGVKATGQMFINRFRLYTEPFPVVEERNSEMNWVEFSGMTDEDLGAIWDYLRSLPPLETKLLDRAD